MASIAPALERWAAPLDRARRGALALALKNDVLSAIVRRREHRLATLATLQAGAAFLLSLLAPALLFVLGPVVFGIVHVASDMRYLVLRRSLPQGIKRAISVGCASLLLLRVIEELAGRGLLLARAEVGIAVLLCVLALVAGGGLDRRRTYFGAVALLALAIPALIFPLLARLVLLHAHNLVALAIFHVVFRARGRAFLAPLLLTLGGALFLASGVAYRFTLEHGQPSAFGLHVLAASDSLAPGLRADYAVGVVSSYVFLQSIHYVMWLFLIPQQDSPAAGAPTFRMSLRSALHDFGRLGILAVGGLALAVLIFALYDVHRARNLYLSLAMFHAYLELWLFCFFWARPGAPLAGNASASPRGASAV